MRIQYLLFALLFISSQAFSQSAENDCWKCIQASESNSMDYTIKECSYYLNNYGESQSSPVASFILARTYMKQGHFSKAIGVFSAIKSDNKILSAYVKGLQGDCYSELEDITKALLFYESAAIFDVNELTTPVYLYKAFLCANSLGEISRGQLYINSIQNNFESFDRYEQISRFKIPRLSNHEFELPKKSIIYQGDSMGFGVINGKPMNSEGFIKKFNKQIIFNQELLNDISEVEPIDEEIVWQEIVRNHLIQKEYSELGLKVSREEFDAYLFGTDGFSVLPDIENAFTSVETGFFDPELLRSRIDKIEYSNDPEIQEQWKESRIYYMKQRLLEKLTSIFKQGVYITKLELALEIKNAVEKKDISFFFIPYSDINFNEITVPEDLLKSYYDEHKEESRYQKTTDSREFVYLDISAIATYKDTAQFMLEMELLKNQFKNAENDSIFTLTHSEISLFVPQLAYLPDNHPNVKINFSYPANMQKEFTNAKVGDVIGPYEDGGTIRIAKVLKFRTQAMTVRHILIGAQRADVEGVEKAGVEVERLMKEINQANFEEYVKRYSDDPGSKDRGGVYADFLEGEMVPEFNDYSAQQPIGKIGYVQTDFGFHIMEVLERKPVKNPNLAMIEKTIKISKKSIEEGKLNAEKIRVRLQNELIGLNGDAKRLKLKQIAHEENAVVKTILINDNDVFGFEIATNSQDEILKFMFNSNRKAGDIAPSVIIDEDRLIVGMCSLISKKETTNFEDVRTLLKRDFIQDQESKALKEKLQINGTLKEMATKFERSIRTSSISMNNGRINGYGFDSGIIGVIMREKELGLIETPLVGNEGVLVVKITESTRQENTMTDKEFQNELLSSERRGIHNTIPIALIKRADVINNVRLYRLDIRK